MKTESWSKLLEGAVIFSILLIALYLRVYRTQDLLGFYYDQGRDALAIWNFIHNGKLFLVGPVTGLAGIFLGPLYYYLITPFYFLGKGDPSYPAIFLATLSVVSIYFVYLVGKKIEGIATGLIAAIITSLSYYLVQAGRWLANPTPILLSSILIFFCMWKIALENKKIYWILFSLLIGFSLQFESASAVFYLPMAVVFFLWKTKFLSDKENTPRLGIIITSLIFLFLTLVPQILFNQRHDNILFDNFKRVLFQEKSFKLSFWQVLPIRLNYFWTVFYYKLFPGQTNNAIFFTVISFLTIFSKPGGQKEKTALSLFAIFLLVPILGYILFQGNFGNIYDYYMTGYYLIMVLLFSWGLGILWKKMFGKMLVLIFFILFLNLNLSLNRNFLFAKIDESKLITLGTQLKAVDWILKDQRVTPDFNVDVYVPPVIPYSYDYLFLWQGNKICGATVCGKTVSKSKTVYSLNEIDPPAPDRLKSWLDKEALIGQTQKEAVFGADEITVQKRTRTN